MSTRVEIIIYAGSIPVKLTAIRLGGEGTNMWSGRMSVNGQDYKHVVWIDTSWELVLLNMARVITEEMKGE